MWVDGFFLGELGPTIKYYMAALHASAIHIHTAVSVTGQSPHHSTYFGQSPVANGNG